MKKHRKAKQFLEEYSKVPIVSVACEKVGISRNTLYKWKNEDSDFKREFEKADDLGVQSFSDLAHSKLALHLQRGEPWAIKFWLGNRDKHYIHPRQKDFWTEILGDKKVGGFEVIIRQGKTSPTVRKSLTQNDE